MYHGLMTTYVDLVFNSANNIAAFVTGFVFGESNYWEEEDKVVQAWVKLSDEDGERRDALLGAGEDETRLMDMDVERGPSCYDLYPEHTDPNFPLQGAVLRFQLTTEPTPEVLAYLKERAQKFIELWHAAPSYQLKDEAFAGLAVTTISVTSVLA